MILKVTFFFTFWVPVSKTKVTRRHTNSEFSMLFFFLPWISDRRRSHDRYQTSRGVLSSLPPPPPQPTTTATHHTHLLYLLGKREVERKQAGRGGGRQGELKNKSKAISCLKWACWGVKKMERGKEKISATKTRAWKRTWKEFSDSVSVIRSGESLTVFHRRIFFCSSSSSASSLQKSYSSETGTRGGNWKATVTRD